MTEEPPIIVVFTADPALTPLEGALQATGLAAACVSTLEAGRRLLRAYRGRALAVLDVAPGTPYSIDAAHRLLHQSPPVPTLLLFRQGDQQAIRWDYGSALDDWAYVPAPIDQLVQRVRVLLGRTALPLPPAWEAERSRRGRVVAVFGPKGGVGRSTIAVNLAVGLARLYGKQVALIDADLWFGDIAVLLDVHAEPNLAWLQDFGTHWDEDFLHRVLIPHPAGVDLLCAPRKPTRVETIAEDLPARAAAACRGWFDFVVVDTHTALDEHVIQVLDDADDILLVTTPEVGPLRSVREVLELVPTLGWQHKLLLVVNRADSGVAPDAVERTLGRRVDARIVSAGRRMVEAANLGKPVLLTDPAGTEPVTRDLGRLVARLMGEPEPHWDKKAALWRRPLARLGRRAPVTRPGMVPGGGS